MRSTYELFNLIGKNLSNIRKNKLKISQEQLAEESGMSRGFISQIESQGVDVGISLDTLFHLAQLYKFDIRDFFEDYEKFTPKQK